MSNPPPSQATNPHSAPSKTAGLACWLTGGGTRRSPTTAVAFLQMAHERNAVAKAEAEWRKRKKAALGRHQEQWGNMGLMGMAEEVAAIGPRPRGTALLRWWEENGGGGGRRRRRRGEGEEGGIGRGRTIGEGTGAVDLAGEEEAAEGGPASAAAELLPAAGGQPDDSHEHTESAAGDGD